MWDVTSTNKNTTQSKQNNYCHVLIASKKRHPTLVTRYFLLKIGKSINKLRLWKLLHAMMMLDFLQTNTPLRWWNLKVPDTSTSLQLSSKVLTCEEKNFDRRKVNYILVRSDIEKWRTAYHRKNWMKLDSNLNKLVVRILSTSFVDCDFHLLFSFPVLKKCFDGFCQDGSIHVDTIGKKD